jgi:hypothetical protein
MSGWAFMLARIVTTHWETAGTNVKPNISQARQRFPKFVLGFKVAFLLVTYISSAYSLEQYDTVVKPDLVSPIKGLRTRTFIGYFFPLA